MKFLVIIVLLLIIFLPNNLLAYNPDVQSAPFQFGLPQISTDIIFNFLNKLTKDLKISNFDINNRGDNFISDTISKSNILSQFINFWSDLIKTFLNKYSF